MASTLLRVLTFTNLLVVGSVCFAAGFESSSCDESVLPAEVAHVLSKKYSSWRVVILEDLSLKNQRLWRDTKSDKCPGIAVGNFEPAPIRSYALLLVSRGPKQNGLKLVVLVRDLEGGYQPHLIDDINKPVNGQVIYKVPPGRYFPNADASEGIQLVTDGLKREEIGVGAVLYFWDDARYVRSNNSKGYSELFKTKAGEK